MKARILGTLCLRSFTNILDDQDMRSAFFMVDGLDECQAGLPELPNKITQK